MNIDRQIAKRRRWSAAALTVLGLIAAYACGVRSAAAQSPYATELIAQNGAYGGNSLYNDPNAVLGEPTRIANNNDPILGISPFHTKIVEAAYNVDLAGNKVITTLSRKPDGAGGFTYGAITVKFGHPIEDDPANPYGIDLNVYGNAFYVGAGAINDTTDLRAHSLAGGIVAEPVAISVSPDNVNWYTYNSGPYGDTAFPTQGHAWSATQFDANGNGWTANVTDFTKPVNPSLAPVLAGQSLPTIDAIGTYLGSGGGTGIDLAPSGFQSIQYVRVEATSQFRDGEIDAFADVRPMHVGDSLSITPANVESNTKLYFKNTQNPIQTALVAEFNSVNDLAKLSTAPVTNSTALAVLPDGDLLASYQLDVAPLMGDGEVSFAADYQLQPGQSYAGDGVDLALFNWNGSAWQPVGFTYDALSGRLVVADWTNRLATFAIVGTASDLDGDFNHDGQVDAADFAAGRKNLGNSYFNEQYTLWRANFGNSQGNNQTLVMQFGGGAVPEPGTIAFVVIAAIGRLIRRPRRT